MTAVKNYERNVFINCPFDDDYNKIFNAILFVTHRCGFILRCSKEFDDSNEIRIKKIVDLIGQSKYSIHDLSRVTLDTSAGLPRFNMPLELGICMGALEYGTKRQKDNKYLVIESERFRFKQFISDISGQDIENHEDKVDDAIRIVRDWLSQKTNESIPSASIVITEFKKFNSDLPELCEENRWLPNELTFGEYSALVTSWLTLT
jgi:hypothetical protein